jgi:prepilin-type N-terminal cleavage/methylation domain-containing protein
MTTHPSTSQPTGGFTLVEVMVSMTLLAVASLALGTLLFRAARQANAASTASYQTAMINSQASRLSALPFDQLPAAGTTCVNVTTPFTGTQCTTINNVSSKVKQVTVVITPSGNPLLNTITSTFTRSDSCNSNPLKTE